IATLTWLENYLINYDGALIIVSHDRYFLDKVVTTVYEVAQKQLHKYTGTYSQFLSQKEHLYELQKKRFEKQRQERQEMEQFIERNIARASTSKRAQSRRKQLEKMEEVDRPFFEAKNASFSFEVAKTSGNDVLTVRDFSFTYADEHAPI